MEYLEENKSKTLSKSNLNLDSPHLTLVVSTSLLDDKSRDGNCCQQKVTSRGDKRVVGTFSGDAGQKTALKELTQVTPCDWQNRTHEGGHSAEGNGR